MTATSRIEAALRRAQDDIRAGRIEVDPDGRPRTRRLAIGDPQAPFEKFLAILDGHGLLGEDGRLVPDAHLVSMGDHYDWGTPAQREEAIASADALVAWLSAHAPDHVTMIAGNHDLARVGELAGFDDAAFLAARAEADTIYVDGDTDEVREAELLRRYPAVPTAEMLARDFATFRTAQRDRVTELLRRGRLVIGSGAAKDFLLVHAGVTDDELDLLGLSEAERRDAFAIAAALNGALARALASWTPGTALQIPGLHLPGSAASGEARGMFFHRPSNPAFEKPELFAGPPRRRFDPRRLPKLTQAIGHIRDNKCRKLLRSWHDGASADDGPLRTLDADRNGATYRRGTPPPSGDHARIYFTDGGMSHADPARYELLDLDTRAAARR